MIAPPEALDASFLAAVYQASQVWYVAPNRATFDELQSTGRITLLEDPDLRTALANHYLRSAQAGVTLQQTSQYPHQLHKFRPAFVCKHCGYWVSRMIEACGWNSSFVRSRNNALTIT